MIIIIFSQYILLSYHSRLRQEACRQEGRQEACRQEGNNLELISSNSSSSINCNHVYISIGCCPSCPCCRCRTKEIPKEEGCPKEVSCQEGCPKEVSCQESCSKEEGCCQEGCTKEISWQIWVYTLFTYRLMKVSVTFLQPYFCTALFFFGVCLKIWNFQRTAMFNTLSVPLPWLFLVSVSFPWFLVTFLLI